MPDFTYYILCLLLAQQTIAENDPSQPCDYFYNSIATQAHPSENVSYCDASTGDYFMTGGIYRYTLFTDTSKLICSSSNHGFAILPKDTTNPKPHDVVYQCPEGGSVTLGPPPTQVTDPTAGRRRLVQIHICVIRCEARYVTG